jgi:hypothetical protein
LTFDIVTAAATIDFAHVGTAAMSHIAAIFPSTTLKHEKRSGRCTSGWLCICAVVEESKLRQLWKQTNKIDPAVREPLPDPGLRNIVSASRDAGTNTCNVEFWCRKTDVPDSNFDPLRERSQKEPRDGFASERGLKCERRTLCDGFLGLMMTPVATGARRRIIQVFEERRVFGRSAGGLNAV